MSKVADEYEEIARRLKELEADRRLALTGTTLPEKAEETNWSYTAEIAVDYGY